MGDPRIRRLGRAVPAQAYPQASLLAHSPWGERALLERLFLDSPIAKRHFAIPPEWARQRPALTDTNAAWREAALALSERALRNAIHDAELDALDHIAVTTVTGYATPGLDLLLGQRLGLSPDYARAHFNCIGCHAALPLLKVAADHVGRRPGSVSAAVAVEVCSACFSERDDPENFVAVSLFADGAAAAIVADQGPGALLVDFASAYDFEHIEKLGFDLDSHGFRIILDPAIPERIGANIEATVHRLLARHGLTLDDIGVWAFHPGGSRILDAVARNLRLSADAMRPSFRVLRNYGNMSSPSVLFALHEATPKPPPPGTWGVLAAFGPGLGIEATLVQWTD